MQMGEPESKKSAVKKGKRFIQEQYDRLILALGADPVCLMRVARTEKQLVSNNSTILG